MNTEIFTATNTATMLLNDFVSDKVSHAYMLIGDNGSGKYTLANAFSQLLLCEAPHGTVPCGKCACCSYFESLAAHPNVTVVSPENKASIGIKDIRDMSDGVYTAPYMGSKKVYIIRNAEKMTQQAQNALLKVIEEPPEHALFFLLSASRYAMLATVISRCRTLSMTPYSEHSLKNIIFEKNPELLPEQANTLIGRSQGNPGRLISFLSDDGTFRNAVLSSAEALIENNMETVLDSVQNIDSREDALKFIYILNEIMRDTCMYKICGKDAKLFNTDKTDLIHAIANSANLKRIVKFLNEIAQTEKMLNGNVSYLLCLKSMLLKW